LARVPVEATSPSTNAMIRGEKEAVPFDDTPERSEKRNLLIAERTSDLITITTFADAPRYVYVSPSHKRILGYQPYDLAGKSAFDLIHPDDRERPLLLLKQYVQARNENRLPQDIMGVTERITYRLKDAFGEWRYLETTSDLLDNNFILSISRDITEKRKVEEDLRRSHEFLERQIAGWTEDLMEANKALQSEIADRKRIEGSLRESEERYRTFINSIEDGYYEVGLSGNMTFFNESMRDILGYSSEELMGMNNREYMSQTTAKAVYETFNEVYRTGKSVKAFDWEFIRKDGERRFLETSVSLILDAKGSAIGFRGIARDITDGKKMIQELEALNQTKEKIISHLSHELITPIALVEASLEHLNKADVSESLKENNVRRIRRNLDRLKDLQEITSELLAPRGYEARPLQVDLFIQNVLENILSKSAHRSLDFAIHLEPIYTDIIDPMILDMILTTLVKNSIESTPDEGRIVVSLTRTSEGVLLQVQDHGVGITASDKEFILRGFYHTQNTQFYSTRRPFDFNAGGKGLELMRLKLFAADGAFDLSFESKRCKYIPADSDRCCGRISSCRAISSVKECIDSGGTTFSVLFSRGPLTR
jgi:PAS domain S-box-containing protein